MTNHSRQRNTIRPALVGDTLAIAKVHVDTWRAAYTGIVPQTYLDGLSYDERAAMWQKTLSAPNNSRTFVSVEDGHVVGFAGCGPVRHEIGQCRGELYALYVLPEAQGRSHGRKLFELCSTTLRERRLVPFVVWAFPSNPAVGFYEKMGGAKTFQHHITIGDESLAEVGLVLT